MRISAEKINWRVALGELSLIVIGILMALAIDSYVGERADRAVANEYLADLVAELQSDAVFLAKNYERIGLSIEAAEQLLRLVESGDEPHDDPGGLLVQSIMVEAVTRQPAVWTELQMTGALRLVPEPSTRSAIVAHYVDRANAFSAIEQNFLPAARDLRAVAWDVLPVDSFGRFVNTGQSGVPAPTVIAQLRSRDDSVFLLKRMIVTGTVARVTLDRTAENVAALLRELGVPREPGA